MTTGAAEPDRTFGDRLTAAFSAVGRVCAGIDPHAAVLRDWGLPDSAAGVREFGLRMVDAAAGTVAAAKPQVAFYERHGSAGFAALEEVLAAARAAGLLVIADGKRGEIGSSMAGYADAWLRPGSPLEADAMTLNPYLGVGALAPTIQLALRHGKGVFVLAATSNPEGQALQRARAGEDTLAAMVVDAVRAAGGVAQAECEDRAGAADPGLGSAGVVIGATVPMSAAGIAPSQLRGVPILAPGFGHQGASAADLHRLFGEVAQNVLVSASRSLVERGPEGVRASIAALNDEVARGTATGGAA